VKRLWTALIGVCIATASFAVIPAPSASAAAIDLECTGGADIRFSPGLTYTPQNVTVIYNTTVGCEIAPLRISDGLGFSTFTIPGATCTNLATVSSTANYNWSPKSTSSTVNYATSSLNIMTVGQLVQKGGVSAGELSGDQALDTITLQNINLTACSSSTGLTLVSGPEVLTFYRIL
jgi:hypothetical protein